MKPLDEIYVLKDGRRLGPFSVDALLDLVENGDVRYDDACLRADGSVIERVRDLLDWDESEAPPPEPAATVDGGDDSDLSEAPEDDIEEEAFSDDSQGDPRDAEAPEKTGAERARRPAGPRFPTNPNALLFSGHPSILSFPKTVALIAAAIGLGWHFREWSGWCLFAGLLVALFGVSWILFERAARLYLITPKRVEIVTGIVARDSNEVRIEDIRTINVRRPGLRGLLGVGTVEFSSSGGSGVEVSFADVYSPNRIKSLVRRLQDARE
ncbi:MAG: PH domain-containing protein [Verrucomicrobiae bacterium]|nr:PH domain-containing protein [Verrucomicrobiae bacterium]MCP5539182.1 PH domain-containing protein [Akkermansiaceae bacterium]MCP5549833.1 PH domain-containing protein [Akkermansiaceae bacterium]